MGHWKSLISNTKRAWWTEWHSGGVWLMGLAYLVLVGAFGGINWCLRPSPEPDAPLEWWWFVKSWPAAVHYFIGSVFVWFAAAVWCAETLRALRGERVSWGRGCREVWARKVPLLVWLVFNLVVTLGLGLVFGWGPLLLGVLSMVWGMATMFALPALVKMTDGWNPLIYLKRSCVVFGKVWLELLLAYLGVMFLSGIIIFIFVMAVTIVSGGRRLTEAGFAVGGVGGVIMVVGGMIVVLWIMLYVMSLYLYATEDQSVPEIGNASPR